MKAISKSVSPLIKTQGLQTMSLLWENYNSSSEICFFYNDCLTYLYNHVEDERCRIILITKKMI